MVPPPLQAPLNPANAPDCAWLVVVDMATNKNATAANTSRRAIAKNSVVRSGLLPRSFPSTAARYACRCTIPLPRTCLAAEMTVRICTIDRDAHKSLFSDASGQRATSRDLAIRDGQRGARGRLAAAGFGHDRDIPEPVIGVVGGGGGSSGKRAGDESGSKKR